MLAAGDGLACLEVVRVGVWVGTHSSSGIQRESPADLVVSLVLRLPRRVPCAVCRVAVGRSLHP